MTALSPQRAEVLSFIRRRVRTGRGFPSRDEIAKHMGWRNTSSAMDVLKALSALGHIRMVRAGRRGLRFMLDASIATDFDGDDDADRRGVMQRAGGSADV